MKKLIIFVVCLMVSPAFAAEQNLVMSCKTTFINDGGYQVDVVSGGVVPGLELALIKEVKRNSTDYTDAVILKRSEFGTHIQFSGKNFALTVQLESRLPSLTKSGELSYDGKIGNVVCVLQ